MHVPRGSNIRTRVPGCGNILLLHCDRFLDGRPRIPKGPGLASVPGVWPAEVFGAVNLSQGYYL